jgi:NAD(P)-dependent dehydrogenase (short-subunit alcohol dehydrogenase family)
MSNATAVIIGVGADRGLGARLCHRFAKNGLHVVVAGRTQSKVDTVAESIRQEGGTATAVEADATNEAAVIDLFRRAEQIGPVELAIYNAGNNMPHDLLTMEAEFFERCWRIACYGAFLFGREAARTMRDRGNGTLLFTGASASLRGKPLFAAFTAAKAGMRAFAQSMAREFCPQGIHVAHVVVDGAIDGDRIRKGFPQLVDAWGEDRLIDLEGIVDLYEMLYRQPKRAWTHELDVRSFNEVF